MSSHVLLIDDDARLSTLVRDYLQAAGYRISMAANLAQGRALLQREPVDALVLDLMLPDGDGLDLTRELRADPRLRHLPLLMLTLLGVIAATNGWRRPRTTRWLRSCRGV